MNTSVIIRKHAGHVIPRGYLQEALKNCPTCFGIAVQDRNPETKDAVLSTSAEAKAGDIDVLMKIIEGCKDLPMFIQLGHMTQDFDPSDDLQPFTFQMAVEGEDPEDILAVMLEGDFPNYAQPGKGHVDEYHLWEKFIFPTLLEKFDLANSDPEDFFNRLRASPFEQAIMNTVGHRAAIVFIPMEGEPIAMGRNDIGGEFDWGTTSNRFKWGDPSLLDKAAGAAIDAVKTTVSKGKGRLAAVMGSAASNALAGPKAITTDPVTGTHTVSATTVHDTSADTWKRWPNTSAKTHTMTVVPKKLQGNARNRWIRLMLNLSPNDDLPKGKDIDGFMIPVPNQLMGFAQQDLSTNDEVKTLAASVKHFQATGSMTAISNADIKEAADEPMHTAAPPKDKEARPSSDFLPELSAEAKKGTVDLVTDWATRAKGPTKLDIQRIESKWPKFSTTMGIKLENLLGWSIADKKLLAKKYPDSMALAFTELQLHILENGVGLTTEETKQEPGKPDTHKTQVEVPSPQPQPAAAGKKKSRLAQLTAA